jgi:hypothetical protein
MKLKSAHTHIQLDMGTTDNNEHILLYKTIYLYLDALFIFLMVWQKWFNKGIHYVEY